MKWHDSRLWFSIFAVLAVPFLILGIYLRSPTIINFGALFLGMTPAFYLLMKKGA